MARRGDFGRELLVPAALLVAVALALYPGQRVGAAGAGPVVVYAARGVRCEACRLGAASEATPRDLAGAGMVDGATRWQAFVRVVLPAARPALAVTCLFAFMSAWNEFILAAT